MFTYSIYCWPWLSHFSWGCLCKLHCLDVLFISFGLFYGLGFVHCLDLLVHSIYLLISINRKKTQLICRQYILFHIPELIRKETITIILYMHAMIWRTQRNQWNAKRKIEIIVNSLNVAHKCWVELLDENCPKRTEHSNSSSVAVFYIVTPLVPLFCLLLFGVY